MSVYKREGVWWYDFSYKGDRFRGSTFQRYKVQAEKREADIRASIVLGRGHREAPTLAVAAQKWHASKVAGLKSERTTIIRVKILFQHIDPSMRVCDIDTPDVEAAIQSRRAARIHDQGAGAHRAHRAPTNATVNRDIIDTTLRPILTYCRKTLKVPGMQEIDWPALHLPEPKERVRAFSPVELGDWTAGLPAHHRALHGFMATYGCRLSEAFFPLADLDIQGRRVTFRNTKNGHERKIPLIDEDVPDMAARLGRARAAGLDTVWFRVMRNGTLRPIVPRGFQSASKTALQRAGLSDARPAHDLRHHAATELLRATGSLKTVQALLGHESITSTARYAHADERDVALGLRHARATRDAQAEKTPLENNVLEDKVTGT